MRERRAQIIRLSDKPEKHFASRKLRTVARKTVGSTKNLTKARRLSPSEIAELPILLT